MNLNRIIVILVVLITGIFVAQEGSFAAKSDKCSPWPACKDDGDPPPPPTGCNDTFPGFLYKVEGTRKAPAELHLASSDGCRTERVAILPNLRGQAFHMTSDRSKGVIVWSEDIDNQYIVRRLDFTVDEDEFGNLALAVGQPVTVLPLAGEESLPGDHNVYFSPDIWGNATHDSLYLTILRWYSINSGPDAGGGSRDLLIYDLNDLTGNLAGPAPDERLLFHLSHVPGGENQYGDWLDADPMSIQDCNTVDYPQFVPSCYLPEVLRVNPSGTRIYVERSIKDRNGERWEGTLRINIDSSGGADLADWTLTGPELVYVDGPGNALPRPGNDPLQLPSPEIVTAGGQFLNADQCAANYAPYADGNNLLSSDFWQACIAPVLVAHGDAESWESPGSYLFSRLESGRQHDYDIYRVYVSGALADIEELLIETARFADTGL